MKEFLVNYKDMYICEYTLTVVKAKSSKAAKEKFYDYWINNDKLIENFFAKVDAACEEDYFNSIMEGIDYDLNKAHNQYIMSKKCLGNNKKFKNLNLEKVIVEINNDKFSVEVKDAIFRYLYECIELIELNKCTIIE